MSRKKATGGVAVDYLRNDKEVWTWNNYLYRNRKT